MVKNLPCNAGDAGLIPGWGTKIPHAVEQLSPCPVTTKSMCRDERSCMTQLRLDAAE